ncbi:hypothetical protein CCACVL1_15121 [Corchorus capsularis]|uniref:F-box domain-containing protein n=1 Tax=Corchorus capsularis TaxID=210143 RepID=A0A1R3I3X1_COCAP|nr:hypothetical protein CCACVL1_15121 [Corchorus capsularis]
MEEKLCNLDDDMIGEDKLLNLSGGPVREILKFVEIESLVKLGLSSKAWRTLDPLLTSETFNVQGVSQQHQLYTPLCKAMEERILDPEATASKNLSIDLTRVDDERMVEIVQRHRFDDGDLRLNIGPIGEMIIEDSTPDYGKDCALFKGLKLSINAVCSLVKGSSLVMMIIGLAIEVSRTDHSLAGDVLG